MLVIENLHTYDSFRRWNDRSRAHAAVAYGHGHEFKATCRDLPRVCERVGTRVVEYFGDLDRAGLEIAAHAQAVLRIAAPDLRFRAAERWYTLLLEHRERAMPISETRPLDDRLFEWLPAALRSPVRDLLASGQRLPQEIVGTERLIRA